jgi:hypothetical protein
MLMILTWVVGRGRGLGSGLRRLGLAAGVAVKPPI